MKILKLSLILVFTVAFAPAANAQQPMYFSTLSDGPAGVVRCLSDVVSGTKRCWMLKSIPAKEIPGSSSKLQTTKIRVVEVGRSPGDRKVATFMIAIEWEAESRGKLSFSGPKGKLYATGALAPNVDGKYRIDFFADDAPSEQFDRGVAFGTNSPSELHELTLAWLNEVVGPFIASSLEAVPIQPLR